jgi:hypothetical protein
MSDFLTRLAERQLRRIETIEPRIKPLYASTAHESQVPALIDDFVPQPLPRLDEKAATSPVRQEMDNAPHRENPRVVEPRHVPAQTPALERDPRLSAAPVRIDSEPNQPAPRNVAASPSMAATISPIHEPAKIHPFDAPKLESSAPSSNAAPLSPTRTNSEPAPLRKTSTEDVPAEREIKLTAPLSLSTRNDRIDERPRPVADAPVQVTIGRIEVTALVQAAAPKRAASAHKPNLSLDDYLARRHGRER